MKNLYISPEIRIEVFSIENIVTESGLTAVEKATASLSSQQLDLDLEKIFVLE